MSSYTIVPASDGTGYNVAIVSPNGLRQTMLGFATEADAEAWIEQTKRLEAATRARDPDAAI